MTPLQLKDNSIVVIDNKIIFPIFVEVYNLEIEDNENYYVTEERIRVHNGNVDQLKKIEERDFKDVKATRNTPVRDKFIIQIVLTALIFYIYRQCRWLILIKAGVMDIW